MLKSLGQNVRTFRLEVEKLLQARPNIRHYCESPDSPTFPGIPVRQWIPAYLRRAWEVGSSVALREFESDLSNLRSGA